MTSPSETAGTKRATTRSVLFLDDEQSYVDLMGYLLAEHLACPILTHTKPKDALAALPGSNVAVIVTDYYMPVMNGLEFIRDRKSVV